MANSITGFLVLWHKSPYLYICAVAALKVVMLRKVVGFELFKKNSWVGFNDISAVEDHENVDEIP